MLERHNSLDGLKRAAKDLRQTLFEQGEQITHCRSLELVAQQRGYRDWNTLYASVGNTPPAPQFQTGMRLEGRFRNQPFQGTILAVRKLNDGARFALTLQFDEPVDVITFESMSNFRSRVNVVVDSYGVTHERTSDGIPHMRIEL